MFYRIDTNGNAQIFNEDGTPATRIDANVYPVGSTLSARYEHADGITLTVADAESIGIGKE